MKSTVGLSVFLLCWAVPSVESSVVEFIAGTVFEVSRFFDESMSTICRGINNKHGCFRVNNMGLDPVACENPILQLEASGAFAVQPSEDPTFDNNKCMDPLSNGLKNQKVVKVEVYERPLEGRWAFLQQFGILHDGVVVSLEDGRQYLIHKLPPDGTIGGSTKSGYQRHGEQLVCVTDVRKMPTNLWKNKHGIRVKENAKLIIEDFVLACGQDYSMLNDNCRHCTARMKKQAEQLEWFNA